MPRYREPDDNAQVLVRPKNKKKGDALVYCDWAAGDWEARFYSETPDHERGCKFHVHQMLNNPAWYKVTYKRDLKSAKLNNRAKSRKPKKKEAE